MINFDRMKIRETVLLSNSEKLSECKWHKKGGSEDEIQVTLEQETSGEKAGRRLLC